MNHYELSNYALASSHNPHYIFVLKTPQLISNTQIFFDESTALIDTSQQPQLQPMTYYHLKFVYQDRKRSKIRILQAVPLALLGQEWHSEIFIKHMLDFQGSLKQPEPNNPFMKEKMENGELRVNDEGWIYVKSLQSGFRKKLKLVNNHYAVPLLKGCKVDFFLRKYAQDEGPKVKISRLNFQAISLAGILKMINGRIFFEPRHSEYERMVPIALPQTAMNIIHQCLPNYIWTLPYSIFKRYDGDHSLVNKSLSEFVLQGKFVDWPLKFSHPVIKIESIQVMNCLNLKEATLFEFGIPIQDYDVQQNRLSNQIIASFDPQSYQNRQRVPDRCYTFDCEGGYCYDDAFSFKEIPNGYSISIHISDVPALVEGKPYLLERAHRRDQTIYIKNYYKSMFPQQLRNAMSLIAGKPKLTFSLSFNISKQGLIDYQSIYLRQTIIKVVQNITHGDKISNLEDRLLFEGVVEALKRCKQAEKVLTLDDFDSSTLTAQLLFLSANLPPSTFSQNIKNLPNLTIKIQQFFEAISAKAQRYLKQYEETSNESIKKTDKETMKQRENFLTSKPLLKTVETNESPQQSSMILKELECVMRNGCQSSEQQDLSEHQPSYESESEAKVPKGQEARQLGIKKNEFFRKVTSKEGSAAECYRFLDKLFKAADITVDFSHPKNMELAFKECEKRFKDKIAELYFRTKLIMSKQHFQTIARLCLEGKLKEFDGNSAINTLSPFCSKSKQEAVPTVQPAQIKHPLIQVSEFGIQNESTRQFEQKTELLTKAEKSCLSAQNSPLPKTKQQQQNLPQEGKQAKVEQSVGQHELSCLINYLSYLFDSNQHSLCNASQQQLAEILKRLRSIADKKGIKIIEKTTEQRINIINAENKISRPKAQERIPKDIKALKWNTPIRSGSSLHALTLLKNYKWIFQGELLPLSAIRHLKETELVKDYLSQIYRQRSRQQSMELNGRMKMACRQLDKIDFLFVLRQQPDRVWEFLTITSPSQRVQFVYHEFIEEVEVDNPQKEVVYYRRVKGRFKGTFDFPIKLKVVLLEK